MPPCFQPLQWTMWKAQARITGGIGDGGFCTDCTPEYQAAMLLQNKCVNPLTTFTRDEHGFLQGRLPCNQAHPSQTLDLFTDAPLPPTSR